MCMLTKHVFYATLRIIPFIKLWNHQFEYIYICVIFIDYAAYGKMVNITCICNYFYKICNLFRLVNAVNELMKLENLIDYSACHCRIGKPKLIFHDPFCISFLPVRHAVAQRNLVFSFNRFCTTKKVTFKLSYNIPFCNVEYKTKVIKESNFFISSCYVFSVLIFCLPYHHASDCCKGIW